MTVKTTEYVGGLLSQPGTPLPNFVISESEGLVFTPALTNGDKVTAQATMTYYPMDVVNPLWNSVEIDWTRQADVTPADFKSLFTLYGITGLGTIVVGGEKYVTSCSTSETSERLIFNVLQSACEPGFFRTSTTTTSGTVDVELPLLGRAFETLTLQRNWLSGWSKRKPIPITGAGARVVDGVIEGVTLAYDSDMQADFDDIRFTNEDGLNLLDYALISKTDSSTASFAVKDPLSPNSGVAKNIYAYYGNSGASYGANPWNAYDFYDDFEDGKFTGRSSPYTDWDDGLGTTAVTSTSPLYGTYSLTHLGDGTASAWNGAWVLNGQTSYTLKFRFKLLSQGTVANTPWIVLAYLRFKDNNDHLRLETYYSSPNQYIRVVRRTGGSDTQLATYTWLGSKLTVGSTNDFTIHDTGTALRVIIDTTTLWDVVHGYTADSTYKGVGTWGDTKGMWDRIRISPFNLTPSTIGAVGSEESTITVNSGTIGALDAKASFTLPGDWSNNSYTSLIAKQYGADSQTTKPIPLSSTNVAQLGYDGFDRFKALRLGVNIECNDDYHFNIEKVTWRVSI